MMPVLVALLGRVGLPESVARRAAPVVLAVIVILGAIVAARIWMSRHDAGVVERHEAQLDARAAPAREQAADQRAADTETLHQQERSYHDAIANAGSDGPPDPAAVALNCQRLRRAGVALPPACGPGRGD